MRTILILTILIFCALPVKSDVTLTGQFNGFQNQDCPLGVPSNEERRKCKGIIRDQNGEVVALAYPNNLLNYVSVFPAVAFSYEYFAGGSCTRNSPELVISPASLHPVFVDGTTTEFDFWITYRCS
jgi:hypothetical protein